MTIRRGGSIIAGAFGELPSQTGQSGKFLMTDGTNVLWKDGEGSYHPDILTYQWSDHLFNDISWLRSDTFSWQDGTVYSTAYQHLVDDLNIEETQVITFGNPKVNPETTSTEHVATRSPENDVISSGLYAWYDSDYETLYYTQSENPAINDKLYTVNSDPYGYVVWTVTTEDMPSILPTIETVGSYSIVVYIAEDGHKIVLSDQAETVEDIYDETGVAWYYILDTENQRFKLPRTKYDFVGLRDNVGNYVPESLPNISYSGIGGAFDKDSQSNGAFKFSGTGSVTFGSGSTAYKNRGISFSASDSSSTYQDDAPVQQRATQMYLYFYVGEFSQSAIEQTAGITAETLNDKADTDLSNLDATGQKVIDGQWVFSETAVFNNITLTTTHQRYSLASYLPDDGYDYEVYVQMGTANSAAANIASDLGFVFTVRGATSGTAQLYNTCILPVGSGRYVEAYTSSATSSNSTCVIKGYRRIGTNS